MKTLNNYITEKFKISKDNVKEKEDSKKLSSNSLAEEILNIIGYDDDILYDTLNEWIEKNKVYTTKIVINKKTYKSLENSGCPEIYLSEFLVDDDKMTKFMNQCHKDGKWLVKTPNINYSVKASDTLFWISLQGDGDYDYTDYMIPKLN